MKYVFKNLIDHKTKKPIEMDITKDQLIWIEYCKNLGIQSGINLIKMFKAL